MKMRIVKPFSYSGRRLRAGDEIEMPESFARTMQRMGKVEPAPAPALAAEAKASPKRYRRRDMVAEEPAPEPPAEPDPESAPVELPQLPRGED
jgi:hypothetical protein